jgi:hypothetical protein
VQRHGDDVYILGNYQERNKDIQTYMNGTVCHINGRDHVRKTAVKFMCSPQIELVSLAEPEPCSYSAVFTHPKLCEDGLPFERYFAPERSGGTSDHVRASPYDHWLLTLEKDADDRYICTLTTTLRDLKPKATTCFSNFVMEIQNAPATSYSEVIARHSNRMQLEKIEYKVNGLKVTNDDEFDGSLEFLRVRT